VEDRQIMPADADRILAVLDRLEQRIERVEALASRVAVLERQDQHDREASAQVGSRLAALEANQRAIYRLEVVEGLVNSNREATVRNAEALATKAGAAELAAEATRITALETDRARGEGMSKALIIGWTALTAAPGLVGLALTLWKLIG